MHQLSRVVLGLSRSTRNETTAVNPGLLREGEMEEVGMRTEEGGIRSGDAPEHDGKEGVIWSLYGGEDVEPARKERVNLQFSSLTRLCHRLPCDGETDERE